MYKAAVIGRHDDILAYKAVGFTAYDVEEAEFRDIVRSLDKQEYAVIFVTEEIYEKNAEVIDKYTDKVLPAFIAIPGMNGTTGIGMMNVRRCTERAIGVDILIND
ncbi:MAG: V-type ATP synthase subunit F [Clostridia bacterium]|jgi:V/A-type H+-transporting ATPase subunit F|nr:V-type ATP synthase subunit F [Clostridia bacterium]NLF36083.1 V-type ATP synthase subunit F [Clostridiaceae bacterium]MDD3093057.1 V-type ATP synthase subunit F [Clostridia bacterium]MDD3970802.1 V-type ATP synthase subunit F [Clostridia bacterium]MDD4542859.1 V-type ATP synthase subunit F [Clostridia bacterium]